MILWIDRTDIIPPARTGHPSIEHLAFFIRFIFPVPLFHPARRDGIKREGLTAYVVLGYSACGKIYLTMSSK